MNGTSRGETALFSEAEGKQFRVVKVEAYNLDPEKEDKLKAQIQPGDIYDGERFWGVFQGKPNFYFSNEYNGTIDLQFGFPTCP